jgi:hypothetical protein
VELFDIAVVSDEGWVVVAAFPAQRKQHCSG